MILFHRKQKGLTKIPYSRPGGVPGLGGAPGEGWMVHGGLSPCPGLRGADSRWPASRYNEGTAVRQYCPCPGVLSPLSSATILCVALSPSGIWVSWGHGMGGAGEKGGSVRGGGGDCGGTGGSHSCGPGRKRGHRPRHPWAVSAGSPGAGTVLRQG